ncbi:MAG: translation initiation factor IF-3 [Verrucomicrobiota bacterium]
MRVNNRIRVPQIRCVGADGSQIGIISTREALAMAERAGMDLVEIAPNAAPPVCRIMDYGKYKYEEEKKEKTARKHQTATRVKEVQFHPNVAEHDYQTKLRHIRDFLGEGHRVKVGLFFRGRESAHQEIGIEVMNRVIKDCQDLGSAEQAPKFLGRNLYMLLSPKPSTRAKALAAQQAQPPAPQP